MNVELIHKTSTGRSRSNHTRERATLPPPSEVCKSRRTKLYHDRNRAYRNPCPWTELRCLNFLFGSPSVEAMTLRKSCMIRYHFRSNIQMRRTPAHPLHSFFSRRTTSPYNLTIRLCFSDSTANLGTALAGRQTRLSGESGLGALLDLLIGLGEDELDVAGVGHVGVDLASISTGIHRDNWCKRTRP